jgi:hypothetical protein
MFHHTLVKPFRSPDGFVIALTYGPDRDWVRNVLAAGGCTIEWRGRPAPTRSHQGATT